jgi:hypothetical protein
MDDELEADVDEDVADDMAIVDMSTTWHMTWRPRGATRGRFCCCRVADFVADTWHILWLTRGTYCGYHVAENVALMMSYFFNRPN